MHDHHHEPVEKRNFIRKKIKALAAVCLFLGFCIGLSAGMSYHIINNRNEKPTITRLKGYKFISPLLDYEAAPELKNKEIFVLKHTVEKYIKDKIEKNEAIYVSVYFRDMLNGPWFGINESDNFAPASLLKVPLMIAYLKYAEHDPNILQQTILYDREIEDWAVQNISPDKKLKLGESYSIEDLIYRMIAYSDNVAKDILMDNISYETLDAVYADLGIILPDNIEKKDFITAKEYSSFFRVLFNASYLSEEMSEKALKILSKSTFKVGIVAGVPSDIIVAHKFAERGEVSNQTFQLHDCGIVYHKKRPYILCVMTYGRDLKEMEAIIKEVSEIVYKKIDNNYKKYK